MTTHPTYQEVTLAIKRLKNNKSTGSDGIPAEYLKAVGDVLAEHLHIVLQKVWSEEELPPEWNISVICPIFKNGDVTIEASAFLTHPTKYCPSFFVNV